MKEFVYAAHSVRMKLRKRFRSFIFDRRGSVSCPPMLSMTIAAILGLLIGIAVLLFPEQLGGHM